MRDEIAQRESHGVGRLAAQGVEVAAIVALGEDAMEHRGAGRAVAHADGELQVDERRDPVPARGDVSATGRSPDRLGGAAHLNHPPEAVEAGEPDRGRLLEVAEGVVLEDEDVMVLGEAQHAVGLRRRQRRAGRVLHARGGQVEPRAMLGHEARERLDVRPVGLHGRRDDFRSAGLQEREEVEVAGVVDDHRVARGEQEAADEVERLRAANP